MRDDSTYDMVWPPPKKTAAEEKLLLMQDEKVKQIIFDALRISRYKITSKSEEVYDSLVKIQQELCKNQDT